MAYQRLRSWAGPIRSCHLCTNETLCQAPCDGSSYQRNRFRHGLDIFLGHYAWYRRSVGGAWVTYWVDMVAGPIWEPAAGWRPSSWGIEHAIHVEYHRPDRAPANKWEDPDR